VIDSAASCTSTTEPQPDEHVRFDTLHVYDYFGGIAELMRAVVDHGFKELDKAFARVPVTEDPLADLFAMALTTRRVAAKTPTCTT
jgi:AcrR family transcriptional regulator